MIKQTTQRRQQCDCHVGDKLLRAVEKADKIAAMRRASFAFRVHAES